MKNRSICLVLANIGGIAYLVFLIDNFFIKTAQSINSYSDAEVIGASIAAVIVIPHIACIALAAVFGVLAFFTNLKGLAIASGVLYCVAAVFMLMYFMFMVPMIILSFIGVAKLAKIRRRDPVYVRIEQ